jgi:hypothetical protein
MENFYEISREFTFIRGKKGLDNILLWCIMTE